MDTNIDGLALRKLETELGYYKVMLTKFEGDNERLKADLQKSHEANKSLETDLEIYETRIEELEKVNKELQKVNVEYSKKLKLGKKENGDEATKELAESNDERVKAAYKDGYGTAVSKMSAYLQEMKFDAAITVKQDSSALQKAFLEDWGRYYFKVFGHATTKNRLDIIKALRGIYNVPVSEIKGYVSSLSIDGFGCTMLLESVSEATCKKLKEFLEKAQIECDYYYI